MGHVLIAPRFLNPTLTRSINLCKGSAVAIARSGVRRGPVPAKLFALRTAATHDFVLGFRYRLNVPYVFRPEYPNLTAMSLNLNGPLLKAMQNAGYSSPTPIQARAMPLLLEGRDVLGQAQTGTGKTAAFAIPMLQRIDLERNVPQVLVLTPTRELAIGVGPPPTFRIIQIFANWRYGGAFPSPMVKMRAPKTFS